MLIHHFGSREGLEVAIVQALEQAQRAFLDELLSAPAVSPEEVISTTWRRLADPALSAQVPLFFEIYGPARADVRLGLAVMRGLLLDLLATGDRPAVDQAVERYLQLCGSSPPG